MSLVDNQLIYSDSQDLTATANSTNYVDFGTARNLGSGDRLLALLVFGTVVSNATLTTVFVGADDTGFSTNKITIASMKQITPVTNTYFMVPIGPHTAKRYTRFEYTMSGGTSPHIPTTATICRDFEMHFYAAGAAALY